MNLKVHVKFSIQETRDRIQYDDFNTTLNKVVEILKPFTKQDLI